MAIFKRNRGDRSKKILPEDVEGTQPIMSAEPSAVSDIVSSDVELPPEGEFTPILSFGPNAAQNAAKASGDKASFGSALTDSIESEINSIAGIFESVGDLDEVIELSETTKNRWGKYRERARSRTLQQMGIDPSQAEDMPPGDSDEEDSADVAGGAPIIAPMQSLPKDALRKRGKRPRGQSAAPQSLAFADLRDRDDLDPADIESATEIFGIKYPAGFDTARVDYTGRAIDFSDFSLCDGLKWHHIEAASDISGVVFPASFPVDGADFFGRQLRSCDFSAVYALRWKHIKAAEDIMGIKYPGTFDIENADFYARNISGSDFSLATGLRWEHIAGASDISGIKYPASFNIADADFSDRDISGSDFSLCPGLRWGQIEDAASISGIVYSETFSLSAVDFRGLDISGSDFSRLKKFDFAPIVMASEIGRLKYPACFDTAEAYYENRNISGSNFSRVSSLEWKHIKPAGDITRLVYPPQFDIDGADFTGRDIDYSDFSLLPGFNWQSVVFASSREGLIYPSGFVEPRSTAEEIEGAMLIFLLRLYRSEYDDELEVERFYRDISVLYPGVDEPGAAERIGEATEKWGRENGPKLVEVDAREAHIGDKLFVVKLGFKLLYPRHGAKRAEKMLRRAFMPIFKKHERDRFNQRLKDLAAGKYLSVKELEEIGFAHAIVSEGGKNTRKPPHDDETTAVVMEPSQTVAGGPAQDAPAHLGGGVDEDELNSALDQFMESMDAAGAIVPAAQTVPAVPVPPAPLPTVLPAPQFIEPPRRPEPQREEPKKEEPKRDRVYTFGQVDANVLREQAESLTASQTPAPPSFDITQNALNKEPDRIPERPREIPREIPREALDEHSFLDDTPGRTALDDIAARPVDISQLRRRQVKENQKSKAAPSGRRRNARLSDEDKAIRTGVMGLLLFIHQSASDEPLSNAELFAEFMKIYPGSIPKEAAAMAQFATNTLSGNDSITRSKLFMFASKAGSQIKHRLLDFAYNEYALRLTETEDEEIFREFLLALCQTLFEDSPEYEYSSYLRSRDILKDPPLSRQANYRRIAFESTLGKANLYASEKYPYYRTLQQVGFQHHTFDAVKGNLRIEVADSRYYEDLDNLVHREKEPNLMQFVVVDAQPGYLYLENRCVEDWNVGLEEIWLSAERNMNQVDIPAKYSFASSDCTSFRYIQHDLATYIFCDKEYLDAISGGRDIIMTAPCREIVYIDFYDFGSIKKMLEFTVNYNCSLVINGQEYEHPFSHDVFIYRASDKSMERVNDETYILLGDAVARRQVLSSVLPLNIEVKPEDLVKLKATDQVPAITEEEYNVQEAVFTILRLYSEVNGDADYTLAQNTFMAVADEVYASFDAEYPEPRSRDDGDPIRRIDESAQMAMTGGKTICWMMIQALSHLAGDLKYETPSAAHVRNTVIKEIYGDNANAVWLNCATAADFERRFEATKRVHEVLVQNQHLTILDSRTEVAMHVLTMMFHQFGRRYALGQVRLHMLSAIPNVTFSFEINQSAWLPSPGEDVDVDAQSLGMVFRGFDRAAQDRMLAAFADAVGDRDLAEGGWPLLYFIKFVKYAYLDPVEMVEHYFAGRSRLIPSQSVLKQLYYKDLNNEFIKHKREPAFGSDRRQRDAFTETRRAENQILPDVTYGGDYSPDRVSDYEPAAGRGASAMSRAEAPHQTEPIRALQRPDIQLRPVEPGLLEKNLSFVMETIDERLANSLREAAHYVTKIYHLPEIYFRSNDDIECELHYGIIRSRVQITTLRSFAWTLHDVISGDGRDLRDVTEQDVYVAAEIVEDNNRIKYKSGGNFPVLCSMPIDEGMYIPAYQEYIFFAQELMPEAKMASLFSLQNELTALAPAMKVAYDILRNQQGGDLMPPQGVLFDAVAAWSAYCFAAGEPFEVVQGPATYNFHQIPRE
ncbi:MAG: hypothetical protein FWE86_00455 [Oscillospiraceae bacterium]|nr:hypothetical protein [Oscillospiraceae bacterium]